MLRLIRTSRPLQLWANLSSAILLFTLTLSCTTIELVSRYDASTDERVTELHKVVSRHFRQLKHADSDSCARSEFDAFYSDAADTLDSLIVRNRARPKNTLTVDSLNLLQDSLQKLEALHAQKSRGTCLLPEEIEQLKSAFDTSFSAILKLELAKKRGEGN